MLTNKLSNFCCCWYHKGTNFQANHNWGRKGQISFLLLLIPQRYEFSSKSQPDNRKYIPNAGCCWYHKGTNFQANHNVGYILGIIVGVVADTTKVRIFKQITTYQVYACSWWCCCWYHKGTNFQANHNEMPLCPRLHSVVADTTKVRIFKQITTEFFCYVAIC